MAKSPGRSVRRSRSSKRKTKNHGMTIRSTSALKVRPRTVESLARVFRLLADGSRLKIVLALARSDELPVQLRVTRSHLQGFPCYGRFPSTSMPTPLPRQDRWVRLSLLPQTTAAFPEILPGRLLHLGLSRPARCSLAFRPACSLDRLTVLSIEGFSDLVTSTAAPIASGWSDPLPGRNCTY